MPRPPTHAFVGRTRELADLVDAFESAAATSEPTFTLVSGDAGTGKTRLLEELVSVVQSSGGLALLGSCVQVGDFGLPYLPIIDALRSVESDPIGADVLREEAAVRPALGRLLPQLSSISDAERYRADLAPDGLAQGQLFEGLLRVLGVLSAATPVLLVIEDIHWADRSTRDLIAFLARTLRTGRVAMVASYRTDDLHRRHPLRPTIAELARLPYVHRLGLAPFNRSELALLLDELAGSAVDARLVDRVFARSEGNAFFAEELMRAGRAADARGGLPDELADVLLSRVEELGPAGRRAVRAAAVAGRRVGHDLLVDVADAVDTEEGLRDAVEIGLLTSDGETYAFRHALFQEAVYTDLLPGRAGPAARQIRRIAQCRQCRVRGRRAGRAGPPPTGQSRSGRRAGRFDRCGDRGRVDGSSGGGAPALGAGGVPARPARHGRRPTATADEGGGGRVGER